MCDKRVKLINGVLSGLVRSLNEPDEIELVVTPMEYTNAGDQGGTPCNSQPASTTRFTAALKAMDVTHNDRTKHIFSASFQLLPNFLPTI